MADLRLQDRSAARVHKSQRVAAPLPRYAGAVKKDGAPVGWLDNPAANVPSFIDRERIDTAALLVFLSFPQKRLGVEKSQSVVRRPHCGGRSLDSESS